MITNPIDVVKTRMQLEGFGPVDGENKPNPPSSDVTNKTKSKNKTSLQTFRFIYQSEGLRSFSRGVGARMLLQAPATALSWGGYELIKGLLQGDLHNHS